MLFKWDCRGKSETLKRDTIRRVFIQNILASIDGKHYRGRCPTRCTTFVSSLYDSRHESRSCQRPPLMAQRCQSETVSAGQLRHLEMINTTRGDFGVVYFFSQAKTIKFLLLSKLYRNKKVQQHQVQLVVDKNAILKFGLVSGLDNEISFSNETDTTYLI